MKDKKHTLKKLAKVFCLSLSLAAIGFFAHSPSALARGGGGGMGGGIGVGIGSGYSGYGMSGTGGLMSSPGGMAGYGMVGYNMASYNMNTMASMVGNSYGMTNMGTMMGNGMAGMTGNGYGMSNSIMGGSGLGSTVGNYGMLFNTPATAPVLSTTNTAAMLNAGYTGTAVMPYYGQTNTFGNAYGNTYGMYGLADTTYQPLANTFGVNAVNNGYGMGMDSVTRMDQGNMGMGSMMGGTMGMGSMMGATSVIATNPTNTVAVPVDTTGTPVAASSGIVMPLPNAIDSQGTAGFLNGLGTGASSFTPRGNAAATSLFSPSYGMLGTFAPYAYENQNGFAYGSPWL